MTDQPLGRDRLGRLVYEGDYVWPHRPDDPYWIPVWREENGRVAFDEGFGLAEHTTWPEFVTIDLAASPKRSNYQRYFADLGTFDEICRIVDEICSEEAAKNPYQCPHWCPLEVWTEPYASIFDANELCRIAFKLWLQQEATV